MPRPAPALLLLTWLPSFAVAQTALRSLEVSTIRFEGNEIMRDDDLASVVQTRETPAAFWKLLYKLSEKLGERPEYFDPSVFDQDYARLRTYYHDQGFFSSRIDTLIQINAAKKTIALTFRIHEGARSLIDTIRYIGFDNLPPTLLEEIQTAPYVKVGDPFVEAQVVKERTRIVSAFFNNGFADVHVDSVVANRYLSTNDITLVFAVTRGRRYLFGNISIRQDTTVSQRVADDVIRWQLDFTRGDVYSEAKRLDSERNLNRLGVFESSRIEPIVNQRSDSTLEIPTNVYVRSRPFQELVPEIGVNDANNAFNISFGASYTHRNFLGSAWNFATGLKVQVQSIQDVEYSRVFGRTGLRDSSVMGNAELTFQMTLPYFLNNKTSLTPSLSFIVDKRNRYYFNPIIRGRFSITSQTAHYTTAYFEWSLERIGYEPINAEIGRVYFDSLSIDRRPQFNSIFSFTLQRDRRNDLFFPSAGFFHSGTFEEAGLIPSAFGGLFGIDLPYSKFVKISGRGSWYRDPSLNQTGKLIWALRLYGGFAELYGHSPAPIPINRRFFGGGSGSIRGWRARGLGAVKLPEEGGNAVFETSLEARWNLLKNSGRLWFLDLDKISLVIFCDAGNVWSDLNKVRITEIAMASGLGFRYATVAGPIRVDLGFRVYDPEAEPGRRWITQKEFYKETLSNLVLHFGIGNAF